eukprot:comp21249_c0_seq1/m.28949 comp21249_c0_seq1/g.28949  ORF comp21249_c0_seq1/g.28949 comp21249_c0_seq1/m.28949 type:complete len:600 (-) comp21249_c0_seq1:480-2279(-)
MAAQTADAPVTTLLVRSNTGLSLEQGPPVLATAAEFPQVPSGVRTTRYSNDGSLLAWATSQTVTVVEVATWKTIQTVDHPNVMKVFFSPKNTQLVTFSRYQTDKNHVGTDNAKVWKVGSGEMLLSFVQKGDTWVPQYSDDETIFGRLATNELQLLDPSDLKGGIKRKIYLEGINKYSISPGAAIRIAAFVPGIKGQPAFVRIYNVPNLEQPFAQKSFYKAETVDFEWNCLGTALLVHTHVAVDASNKSYYGENNLYYMSATSDVQCNVQLTKEGPIYETKWSPTADEFVVVHGFMPAKATLFGPQCKPLFDFGTGKRNTVLFSPHGHIICLAGFGNLRGEMEFWDRKKLKKVSVVQAPDSTIYSWAPDSEHLMTATTSPRIRVDNGLKVWHYRGDLLSKKDYSELLNVEWRPAPPGLYPLKPTIPVQESARTTVVEEAKKATAYRPPGARGQTVSFNKYEDEDHAKPKKLDVAAPKPVQQLPPGVTEASMSKAALKNKKKREAKAKKAEEGDNGNDVETEAPKQTQAATTPAPAETPAGEEDIAKKIRAVNKKLRQIAELKDKQKEGKTLEANQLDKLKAEADLLKELAALELQQKNSA